MINFKGGIYMQSDKSIVDFSNIDSCTWQWVKETPVAILEENELPAWKSAEDVCNALETMGADFIRYPAIGWGAHFYSKSDWLPKYLEFDESFDSSRDLFGEICSEIRSRGKKIMAYCHYGVLYRELEQIHPEWLARKPDGSLHMWQDIHRMTCLCNRDFITSMRMAIGEIIKLYRPDAIYIDGPTWYCPRCYCDCCKKEYLQMYGEEMPGELSYEDGSEVKYGKMRIKVIAEVVKGLSKIVREENNIPLIINTSMVSRVTYSQGRAELSYNYCDGANTTEVHLPGNFWDMIISAKAAQIFNKVSLCYCPPGPYHTLRTKDLVETEVMGFAYAMHAGTPMLQPLSSYLFDNTGSSVMNRFLNNIRKHPDIYYRSKPFEEVGLIYSRETTEALEASLLSKYHNNYSGVFNMLLHGHCHFNCLYDTVLSLVDLSRYKILILPENLTISKNTCDVLRQYVKDGGILVATGMTSMYDENIRPMGNFGLADVFGIEYEGFTPKEPFLRREYRETGPFHGYSKVPEAYIKITDISLLNSMKLSGAINPACLIPISDAVVPASNRYIEYTFVKPGKSTEVIADLYLPAGGAFGSNHEFPYGKPPAITVNTYGKGKSIYISSALGYFYNKHGLPDVRNLLCAIINYSLNNKQVLKMSAPAGVIANITGQKGRRFIHLLNYCGNMFEKEYPVEWIAPVDSITIKVREDFDISRVFTLYNSKISWHKCEGYINIELSRLGLYETICLK
jgi:hypothetical protein